VAALALVPQRIGEGLSRIASGDAAAFGLDTCHDLTDGEGRGGEDQRRQGSVAKIATQEIGRTRLASIPSSDHGSDATAGVYRQSAAAGLDVVLRFHVLSKWVPARPQSSHAFDKTRNRACVYG
jgi:hypothetical protein